MPEPENHEQQSAAPSIVVVGDTIYFKPAGADEAWAISMAEAATGTEDAAANQTLLLFGIFLGVQQAVMELQKLGALAAQGQAMAQKATNGSADVGAMLSQLLGNMQGVPPEVRTMVQNMGKQGSGAG